MYLKNTSQLLSSDLNKSQIILRKLGLQVLESAITLVNPQNLMKSSIKVQNNKLYIKNDEYDLQRYKKIYIIGGGKAAAEMTFSLERFLIKLKRFDYEGIINVPENTQKSEIIESGKIFFNSASHPVPNKSGFIGTKSMIDLIEKSTKTDLIFCLISGGGSALLPLPKNGIEIEDLQEVNTLLLSSGASIQEINIVRKHISDFKGGNLAKKIYYSSEATLISLIISDVVGDILDSIASGPTVPDNSTFKDAFEIINKYELLENIPNSVKQQLEKGLKDKTLETPKPNDDCFKNVHNYLIGSIKSAVQEITPLLNENGFEVVYFSDEVNGEAKEFGRTLYDIIRQYLTNHINKKKARNIALIGTGELTVTIRGNGIGGRNQEMLLGFLNYIREKKIDFNFLIIGANLDGIEGNSNAMGAIVDNYILEQMVSKNLDPENYLITNNSNKFFKQLDAELITGSTGCNVNDIILILLSK